MGDEDLVVAVRLCDTTEAEQPDPLCLRQEDLEKWRHFESLLRGMYQNPPDAISVTYLDDENDWVQVGSDAELSEAVRLVKQGGDILQLQVKRLDTEQLITFDNTDSTSSSSSSAVSVQTPAFVLYIPTTDPGGELQPLVYPHPPVEQSSAVDAPKPTAPFPEKESHWLVYPHGTGTPGSLHFGGDENYSQATQGQEVSATVRNSAIGKDSASDRNPMPLWEGAAALSAEEKLKFMMNLFEMRGGQVSNLQNPKKQEERRDAEQVELGIIANATSKMIEPLCLEPGSLGKNFIPNQDPFEVCEKVVFSDHTMINLEKDRSPTLTPKRATNNKNEPNAKFFRASSVETDGAASVSNVDASSKQLLDLLAASKAGQSTIQGRLAYTSALPKSKASKQRTPVPMPRNLLMMEGAQSGANAVAIEIPSESSDFFQGVAVNKEEEIAASGGAAASTSASEETGELMARGGSVASAVSREDKMSIPAVEVYAVSGDGAVPKSEKKVKRTSSKPKHSSSKKDKSTDKKQDACIDGAKPRTSDRSEKRSSEHRKKPEDSTPKEAKKEEKKVKITEDVESGEKLNMKREATTLSRSDFAKYMKKTKKELHLAIVRDVSLMTEAYFSKVVEKSSLEYLINDIFGIREPAFHEGVYCDGCNKEIYGIRYKCGNCLDFDLCSVCENQPNLHDQTHVFLKLRTPAPRAGLCKGQRHCLLVENIYEAERLKSLVLEDTDEGAADVNAADVDDGSQTCKDVEKTQEQTTPALSAAPSTLPKEQELTCEDSQNSSSVDRENVSIPDSQDLDQTCVLSLKKLESSDSVKMCSQTTVLSLKEIVESVPLTKLQPSTPCSAQDHSEDAECDQQSPTLSDSSSSVVLVSPPAVTSTATYSVGSFDEEDMNDLPELISEETVKQLTALKFDDNAGDDDDDSDQGNSSFYEDMGSDTSDDFCVIDPPESHLRRFEYMIIPSDGEDDDALHVEVEGVANPEQSVEAEITTQPCGAVSTTEETPQDSSSSSFLDEAGETIITVQEHGNTSSNPSKEAIMNREEEDAGNGEENCAEKDGLQGNVQSDEVKQATANEVSVDGLVHTMNEEEKARFAQLLRAEMDKEYEWELKRRAFELERELKLQKEKEFQLILEAKERAAAFENEKLEWVTQKKEEEGKFSGISRQTSVASVSSLGSMFDDGVCGSKKDADCQTAPEPLSPASHIIQNVASGVSKAATTAFYTAKDVFYSLQAKQNEWKNASYSCKPPHPDQRLVKPSAEQVDGVKPAVVLPTTPVEERATPPTTVQTDDLTGNAAAQSGDLVENATAIESPTSTSSEQNSSVTSNNGKSQKANPRPVICWVPPRSTFKMPASTWTPPKDDYIPPTSNWKPTKHEFIPPNIEWITTARPGKAQGTAAEADKAKEGRGAECDLPQESARRPSLTSAQKTPTFVALEIADTALRKELQGMQRLIEMGFANREKNRQLLNRFNNDVEKVVQSLLQEEGETEDSHWAFHRH